LPIRIGREEKRESPLWSVFAQKKAKKTVEGKKKTGGREGIHKREKEGKGI